MSTKVSGVTSNTIIVENILQKEVIRLKDDMNIIKQVANTKYEGSLKNQGDTVTVQQFPNIVGTLGGTAGADITTAGFAIAEFNLTVDKVYQNGTEITKIEDIQSNLDLQARVANRFAFDSAKNEDQFIASFATEAPAANKQNDKSPLTYAASNAYSTVRGVKRRLSKQNAYKKGMFLFCSPENTEIMDNGDFLDSTDKGVDIRLNGEVGQIAGFRVMETNHLPHVVLLSMATIPTATDTISVAGVTWTFVANGTAAAAGEISIGTSAAEAQANLVLALNGTGTPAAGTYIEVSAANRDLMLDAGVKCDSFASDTVNIVSFDTLVVAETFTPAGNVFGDDATLMFAVDGEAINFVSQLDSFQVEKVVGARRSALTLEKVYGGAVLGENAKGIATVEIKV